jgi:hypothetical protein
MVEGQDPGVDTVPTKALNVGFCEASASHMHEP